MSNHTPGPWISYADTPSTDPQWHIVTAANHWRVLANVHIEPGNEMDLANARLIVAAPCLLKSAVALINLLMHPSLDVDESIPEIVSLQAAIEKATGESA